MCFFMANMQGISCFLILNIAFLRNLSKQCSKKCMHSFFSKKPIVENFSMSMITAIFAFSIWSDFLVSSWTTLNTRKVASSLGR